MIWEGNVKLLSIKNDHVLWRNSFIATMKKTALFPKIYLMKELMSQIKGGAAILKVLFMMENLNP